MFILDRNQQVCQIYSDLLCIRLLLGMSIELESIHRICILFLFHLTINIIYTIIYIFIYFINFLLEISAMGMSLV